MGQGEGGEEEEGGGVAVVSGELGEGVTSGEEEGGGVATGEEEGLLAMSLTQQQPLLNQDLSKTLYVYSQYNYRLCIFIQ